MPILKTEITLNEIQTLELTQNETQFFSGASVWPNRSSYSYEFDGFELWQCVYSDFTLHVEVRPSTLKIYKAQMLEGMPRKVFDYEELIVTLGQNETQNRFREWLMNFEND